MKVSAVEQEVIHRLFRMLQEREYGRPGWVSRSAVWRLSGFATLQGITFEEATEEVLGAILTMCEVDTQIVFVPAALINELHSWKGIVGAALEALDAQRRKS